MALVVSSLPTGRQSGALHTLNYILLSTKDSRINNIQLVGEIKWCDTSYYLLVISMAKRYFRLSLENNGYTLRGCEEIPNYGVF